MKFLISGRPTRSRRARNEPLVAVSAITATSGPACAPNNVECSTSTTILSMFWPSNEFTLVTSDPPVEPDSTRKLLVDEERIEAAPGEDVEAPGTRSCFVADADRNLAGRSVTSARL